MKIFKTPILLPAIIALLSCNKDKTTQAITIPNGDFENWTTTPLPENWKTNSCPLCLPPFETYIVRQEASAYHGQFAAKFIYNSVYIAWAENKFYIPGHPSNLTAYVKCNLYGPDTVAIKIKLFHNSAVADSGYWLGTASTTGYMKISIPITQNASKVDSALIRIEGGQKKVSGGSTEFCVDNLSFQ